MNHLPPFKAVDDFVKDKEGNKVCMCWGRLGNPKGGEQEAELIAKALNLYHNVGIIMSNYDFEKRNNPNMPFVKHRIFEVALMRQALKTFPNDH